jgi:hypothetical protein
VLNAIRLRKLRRTFSSACQVCPQVLKTRSNALDSAIPALPVHISNTYQYQESHLVKWGVPRGWGLIKRELMVDAQVLLNPIFRGQQFIT